MAGAILHWVAVRQLSILPVLVVPSLGPCYSLVETSWCCVCLLWTSYTVHNCRPFQFWWYQTWVHVILLWKHLDAVFVNSEPVTQSTTVDPSSSGGTKPGSMLFSMESSRLSWHILHIEREYDICSSSNCLTTFRCVDSLDSSRCSLFKVSAAGFLPVTSFKVSFICIGYNVTDIYIFALLL